MRVGKHFPTHVPSDRERRGKLGFLEQGHIWELKKKDENMDILQMFYNVNVNFKANTKHPSPYSN